MVTRRLPLLDMRVMDVPLTIENVMRMPTATASTKDKKELDDPTADDKTPSANVYFFFDPIKLFIGFISSMMVESLHIDMAHFVDEPTELYHSYSWSGSIRTTSGHFAHFIVDGETERVIFPSDYIYYCCGDDNCPMGCMAEDAEDDKLHIGRVYGVGKDFRSNRGDNIDLGQVVLQMQEALRPHDPRIIRTLGHVPDSDELILLPLEQLTYIPEEFAVDFCDVTQDYWYGETMEDPSFVDPLQAESTTQSGKGKGKGRRKEERVPFTKLDRPPDIKRRPRSPDRWVVRVMQSPDEDEYIPLCHTHPIRAELELLVYGRQHFREWDQRASHPSIPVISIPLLTFIDGFGLYRNVFRTLLGYYLTPAGMNSKDRKKRENTFPLFLSPHGSVFDDVIDSLRALIPLDKGVEVTVKGQRVMLCAFTLAYLGDMPQQDHNAGCLGPSASKFCRFCLIGRKTMQDAFDNEDPSEILYFNIDKHGRFCHQIRDMRRMMDSLPTIKQRQTYSSQWGMTMRKPALMQISPALDPIMTRPSDAAHSEYNGLNNLMHGLLIKDILTQKAGREYYGMLRTWRFPPGWHRLQSPIHYFMQYNLSAHAKWSVIIPGLLNFWLKEEHIRTKFWNAAVLHPALNGETVIDHIVRAYAALAKSNSVLMGPRISADDRKNLTSIVVRAREAFQQLVLFAKFTPDKEKHRSSRESSTRMRQHHDMQGPESERTVDSHLSEVLRRETTDSDTDNIPKRGSKTTKRRNLPRLEKEKGSTLTDAFRPNVHIGVHYEYIVEEYGLAANVHTLVGEDKHRKTFSVGDYVTYRGKDHRDTDAKLGRIDGIFVHDLERVRRVFIVFTQSSISDDRHRLLDLRIVCDDKPMIIGATAIEPQSMYIVDTEDTDKKTDNITGNVHFDT
ncbi:hypothetical protein F4804DRAFT_332300 [Jackrogersella minutella]|nr:hypothetical protein F4804DRAFT_332300 [Jackrogersella minutella]